jgi:hypothetical protein
MLKRFKNVNFNTMGSERFSITMLTTYNKATSNFGQLKLTVNEVLLAMRKRERI